MGPWGDIWGVLSVSLRGVQPARGDLAGGPWVERREQPGALMFHEEWGAVPWCESSQRHMRQAPHPSLRLCWTDSGPEQEADSEEGWATQK